MASRGRSDLLPRQIGIYEVLEELGRGGMGVVYLARDPRLDRRIAIKTLSEALSRDGEWNERFSKEARLLASLNHPNIATIHSLERDGDLVYLTMELIPGRSLDDLIRSGSIALPDALSIGRQIARGLEAAHGAGVIHRDLKPLNVMITPDSHAKMLDFGLATRPASTSADGAVIHEVSASFGGAGVVETPVPGFDADEATAVIGSTLPSADTGGSSGSGSDSARRRVSVTIGAGTPGYMSPEQIRGEDLDARTDIWAFGCVLYECLSGVKAFRGSTLHERIRSTLRGRPQMKRLPRNTPEPIRELIRHCLQTSRDARLGDVVEARRVLETALVERSWEPPIAKAADSLGRGTVLSAVPRNLPSEVSPLVGRVREVAGVRELLDRNRLVTLTGVGGGGKTRLVIRVGTESLERFPDGVWMVELAPVTEDAGVTRAAAQTMGIVESAGRSLIEAIVAHITGRSILLILDNCEHVVRGAADLARTLLAAGAELKVLATSRETLGLSGEAVFQVPPLQVPHVPVAGSTPPSFEAMASTESVQLFAQRAAQVRPEFQVGPENIMEIAEICLKLEGIPLALELAAARTRALSLAEIAHRLDDRFRLLKGSSRAALPHHQTLEALIDWSHANITEKEQMLFRRLSLFRGGWTLEAAESVCVDADLDEWEILEVLTRLIDKSLVVFAPGGGSGTGASASPRYRMLETIREYAYARLKSSIDTRPVEGRFLTYFTTLADAAALNLTGPDQSDWLGKLDAEIDNLRAAINQSLEGTDPDAALRITGPMLRYWMIRAYWREGRAVLERAIAMPGAEAFVKSFGTVLNGLGSCCYQLNDLDAATKHYQRAVDGYRGTGERRRAGPPLINLGNVYRLRGELDKAVASLNESLLCFEETDQWMIGAVQMNLGSIALMREQYEEARDDYAKAVGIFRSLGDRVHTATTVMNMGLVAHRLGDYAEARSHLEESAEIFEEIGDRNMGATAQVNLGIVQLAQSDLTAAREAFAKSLRMVRETGTLETIAACFEGFSQLARPLGDVARAARLAGAAEAIRARSDLVRHAADQRQWEVENAAYASEVGEDLFSRHLAEGQALGLDDAVALALEMTVGAASG